jgi:hypothetical protein
MAQRGFPAHTCKADINREANAPKPCTPYCTIFCVHRVALLDKARENPREALVQLFRHRDLTARHPARHATSCTHSHLAPRAFTSFVGSPALRKAALRILNIQ